MQQPRQMSATWLRLRVSQAGLSQRRPMVLSPCLRCQLGTRFNSLLREAYTRFASPRKALEDTALRGESPLVLGMPLHAERKTEVAPFEGFDDAIRRPRRDYQFRSDLADRLVMPRVHFQLRLTRDLEEKTAGL